MLDEAVRFVYDNRAWLTKEQLETYMNANSIEGMNLDEVYAVRQRLKRQLRDVRKKYDELEAQQYPPPPAPTPPLPASPPPERDCAMCTGWDCGCYELPAELNERINEEPNDFWTDCNLGRMGLNTRNYLNEQDNEPPSFITKDENYIDLTCDADGCTYGCGTNCGAAEPYKAEEDYSDMPPLLPLNQRTEIVGAQATPKGWFNPEEEEPMPRAAQPQQRTLSGYRHPQLARMTAFGAEEPPQAPKVGTRFPYNHPVWPSPRAKAVVQWLIRKGRTSKERIRYTLKEPIKNLTHEVSMRYLAHYYNVSHETLLKTSVFKLHNPDPNTPYWHVCPCSFCKGGWSRGC